MSEKRSKKRRRKEKKEKLESNRIPTTHGFRSLGLRRRLTSANLRVFLALPMVVEREGMKEKLGRTEKRRGGGDGCDDGCVGGGENLAGEKITL